MNTSGLSSCNSNWRSRGTYSPHWYTALSVIPSEDASWETLPKTDTAKAVFIEESNPNLDDYKGVLKHTLRLDVKYTLKNRVYHRAMNTLEERILEAIQATRLSENVADLAKRVGVTKQAIYDWKNGKSLKEIKAKYLVKLADIAGYEPLWIMEGRGPKKKCLSDEQKRVLAVMQESEESQILVSSLVDVAMKHQKTHKNNKVDVEDSDPTESFHSDKLVQSEHEKIPKPNKERKTR